MLQSCGMKKKKLKLIKIGKKNGHYNRTREIIQAIGTMYRYTNTCTMQYAHIRLHTRTQYTHTSPYIFQYYAISTQAINSIIRVLLVNTSAINSEIPNGNLY